MAVIVVVAVGILTASVPTVQRMLLLALVLTLTIYPKVLSSGGGTQYVGIAPSTPTWYTFSFVALACLVSAIVARPRIAWRAALPWIPFLLLAVHEYGVAWPHDSLTRSGGLRIGLAIACYIIGYVASHRGVLRPADLPRLLYLVIGVEALAVLSSLAGHPLYVARGPQASDVAGRVIGTADHPDQFAKLILIAMIGSMTYEPVGRRDRRAQTAGLLLGLALIGLAASRAAFFAALAAIAINTLLKPSRAVRRRQLALIGGMLAVGLVAADAIISRFQADPSGGARGQLTTLALKVIGANFSTGVGLNHYVAVVGASDPLTASGVPVHNAYLFTIAEMGFFDGCLFWLPLVLALVIAVRACRRSDRRGIAARAMLALLPTLVLTGVTGWGLLQAPILELLCLIGGVCMAMMRTASSPATVAQVGAPPSTADLVGESAHV